MYAGARTWSGTAAVTVAAAARTRTPALCDTRRRAAAGCRDVATREGQEGRRPRATPTWDGTFCRAGPAAGSPSKRSVGQDLARLAHTR